MPASVAASTAASLAASTSASTAESAAGRDRRALALISAGLCACVAAAFSPAFFAGFVDYDDLLFNAQNPRVGAGLTGAGIAWAFSSTFAGFYMPLTWLSLMLNVWLFGPGPAGFHFVNVLLHAANAVLVLLMLRRMTGSVWRSAAVALAFAVHPLRAESVAWVAERKDVVAAFFGFAAMLAYARYARRPEWRGYLAVVVLFACSLMGKAMFVTLPVLLLVLDYWPLKRIAWSDATSGEIDHAGDAIGAIQFPRGPIRDLILEKLPLLAISIASGLVTIFAEQQFGAVMGLKQLGLLGRLSNSAVSYVRYMQKMVWFGALAAIYPEPAGYPIWMIGGAAALLVGITFFVLLNARRWPWAAVGWLWFFGTMLPMVGIVRIGSFVMADRFMYLPGVGLLVAIVWSIPERWIADARARRWSIGAGGVVAAVLGVFTFVQVGYWHDTFALFHHAVAATEGENNYLAHQALGRAFLDAGNPKAAAGEFKIVTQLVPKFPAGLYNFGYATEMAGDVAGADAYYRLTLESDPNHALANYRLAAILARRDDWADAELYFRRAVAASPRSAEAHYGLAQALAHDGDAGAMAEAIAEARAATAANPRFAAAYQFLGRLLLKSGDAPGAADALGTAFELQPGLRNLREQLESALAQSGRADEAQRLREAAAGAP
jgi:Flp pilus assembly protein TadD